MKYCPECDTEYLDHALVCADCSCDLIDEDVYERARQHADDATAARPFVTLCAVADQIDAERIMEVLAADRVPVHLHTFGETVYIGHTDAHQGYGELWVPREWLAHALARLEDIYAAPPFDLDAD
jgi:hypothetical protein